MVRNFLQQLKLRLDITLVLLKSICKALMLDLPRSPNTSTSEVFSNKFCFQNRCVTFFWAHLKPTCKTVMANTALTGVILRKYKQVWNRPPFRKPFHLRAIKQKSLNTTKPRSQALNLHTASILARCRSMRTNELILLFVCHSVRHAGLPARCWNRVKPAAIGVLNAKLELLPRVVSAFCCKNMRFYGEIVEFQTLTLASFRGRRPNCRASPCCRPVSSGCCR